MSLTQIKNKIIGQLNKTTDEALLFNIDQWLQISLEDKKFEFSEAQKNDLENRINEPDPNLIISNEVAQKEIDVWLKE